MKKRNALLMGLLLSVTLLVTGCGGEKAATTTEEKKAEPVKVEEAVATYVGTEKCIGCHTNVAGEYKNTLHTKMVQEVKADPQVIIGDFSKPGNPFEVATDKKTEDIILTIGSKWKQRYVVQDGDALRILPAEWIVKDQKWQPYNADKWATNDYQKLCTACHTTGATKEGKITEMGIGCEACHGPGSLHAAKPAENKLVKLSELDPKRQTDVCGQCHNRGESVDGREDALGFLPGDDLSKIYHPVVPDEKNLAKGDKSDFHPDKASKKHHQQYNDFLQSKHYNAGVSCFTCHNPHSNKIAGQLKDTPENLCFSCHNEGGKAVTKLDKPFDINKYMPKRAKSATKGDITTHTWIPEQTYLVKK